MDNNLENNDWKKEAPLLAAFPVQQSFSVPEGYFEQLPAQIKRATYLEKLKINTGDTGFITPENYFVTLNEQINAEILAERLKVIAPVQDDAAVTPDYFKKLQASILSKTVAEPPQQQSAKIVRLWRSNFFKYASAACFVLVSGMGLYFYQENQRDTKIAYTEMPTEQMLYDIDEQVIIDHIEDNGLQQIKQTDTDVDLENYILNNYSQRDIASNL